MTDEIVNTTGRRMSQQLEDALDGLSDTTRRAALTAFEERGASSSSVAPLYRAVVLELRLVELRRHHELDGIVAASREVDEPPLPRPTGIVDWWPDNRPAA